MTRKCVADDQYGQLHRKLGELARRIDEGTLDYHTSMALLEGVIEGKVVPLIRNHGLVLSEPINIQVNYLDFGSFKLAWDKKQIGQRYYMPDAWEEVFPHHAQEYKAAMRIAYFEYFGGQQPSTEDAATILRLKGCRHATSLELCSAILAKKKFEKYGPFVIACGAETLEQKNLLCLKTTEFSGAVQSHPLSQPWWPAAYRFAVIQE